MKQGIRVVGKSIQCSQCTSSNVVHVRKSVVVEGGSEVESPESMMGPGGSRVRALMNHYKLAGRADGICYKF